MPTQPTAGGPLSAPWGAPPPQQPSPHSRLVAPPEIWLVVLALLAAGGLLIYPLLRYGLPHIGGLFASDAFTRAISALGYYLFILFAATGTALIALGVGLLRGSRVAQLLTCMVCAIITIATIATVAQVESSGEFGDGGLGSKIAIAVSCICGLIVLLIAGLPGARRHFARDTGRPLGVLLASAIAAYFGACLIVDGLLLLVCGVISVAFVGYGIGLIASGAALIACLRPLRAGRSGARVMASLAFVACIVLTFVVMSVGGGGFQASFPTLLPLGLGLVALYSLWIVPTSGEYFASPQPMSWISPATSTGWVALVVVTAALTAVGLASRHDALVPASASAGGVNPGSSPTPAGEALPTETPYAPSNTAQVPSDTPAVTDSAIPSGPGTAAAPQVQAGPMNQAWSTTYTAEGGYQVNVRFVAGVPQKLQPGLANGQLVAGSACDDINAETDAVVPAAIIATNSSGNFTTYAAVNLDLNDENGSAETEAYFTNNGATCENNGTVQVEWDNGLAPNTSGELSLFIVIHNYYTPENPNGDPAALEGAQFSFSDASSQKMQFSVGVTSGPRVTDGSFTLAGP